MTEEGRARAKVVFLDRATLPPAVVLPTLDFAHDLEVFERSAPHEVDARIAGADIVIVNKAPITAAALQGAPAVKLVAVAATGADNIDLAACRARGVVVSNIRGYAVNAVPEHTIALMLALRRNLIAYRQSVADGRWSQAGQFCYFDYPLGDLAGATLGIVGAGALGGAVGRLAGAFGMRVRYLAHHRAIDERHVSLETLLGESDVISLHCPLTPQTRHMIGADQFAQMRRRPILINTARGGLVDDTALVDALVSGQISGAGLDVVGVEPMPDDHPFRALLGMPNFIVTPHVAWASVGATDTLARQLVDNINGFWAGAPRNVLDPR
ncbi:MAG: D-2-hydroxyacid dehydrogenase [Phenylobacterium sp.]|uniref:D-2-hydroxyacid dehydrogenase n=1 Tax=Phenylobacterium sp. TaxID=1871053 RepID=UPI002736CFBD|nr:D-2-hydroxyacid dehydrogenase [Phenylobacterium sp.]MDP3175444.1 D-2-hydroxyacid dehydrogenase [Phenylobacterium sp.]